ncbi:hypothetical protein TNIN_152231 [Trichonephila inaurata madagascariensis]|uniref:Uncharacterized protein n=1 Tax=Trichonephila inaurata madagascariensis TaxID=2747483 RepID=A0A8X6MDW9_9ARAC|nr:hypothetical protein TNIN_152231 [Trichonephila inaurata madagascariensis]
MLGQIPLDRCRNRIYFPIDLPAAYSTNVSTSLGLILDFAAGHLLLEPWTAAHERSVSLFALSGIDVSFISFMRERITIYGLFKGEKMFPSTAYGGRKNE